MIREILSFRHCSICERIVEVAYVRKGHEEWLEKVMLLGGKKLCVVRFSHTVDGYSKFDKRFKTGVQVIHPQGNDAQWETMEFAHRGVGVRAHVDNPNTIEKQMAYEKHCGLKPFGGEE